MKNKEKSVAALAEMVGGKTAGDASLIIRDFAPLETASESEISFLVKPKQVDQADSSAAGALLVPLSVESIEDRSIIRVKDVYLASAIIHNYFYQTDFVAKGVHPRAFVGEKCRLGKEITISPLAVVGDRATIGEQVYIGPGAVVGEDAEIGDNTTVHANVTICDGTILGRRVIIHSGTVVGGDGYGYAANERGEHIKRPQVGIVRIGDDVEIGSNSCVDRAAYGETWIKSGTKIDNLVQVAHNVVIGENSLIISQVGISGSTTLGRNVVMGGQSGTTGHITIGDRVMVAARGGVHSSIPDGAMLGGAPAIPVRKWAKSCAVFNKLPELQSMVKNNSKAIAAMQENEDKQGDDTHE